MILSGDYNSKMERNELLEAIEKEARRTIETIAREICQQMRNYEAQTKPVNAEKQARFQEFLQKATDSFERVLLEVKN